MSVRRTLSMITDGRRNVACKKPIFGIDCTRLALDEGLELEF